MTAPLIPDYILALYENEIRKVVNKVIKNISEEFDIDLNALEACAKKEITLTLIPEEFETVTITKKRNKVKQIDVEDRCKARLKKNGKYTQCTREAKDATNTFCKMHSSKPKLAYGTINDPLPIENVTRPKNCIH